MDIILDESKKVEIVVFGYESAAHALCFYGLPEGLLNRIEFISPKTHSEEEVIELVSNSRICFAIIVGLLFRKEYMAFHDRCMDKKIPIYFLTDDNLIELGKESVGFSMYTEALVRSHIEKYSGVMVTSDSMFDYYKKYKIHNNVMRIDINVNKNIIPINETSAVQVKLRIGFIGGNHRKVSFDTHVMPALSTLSYDKKIVLIDRARGVPPIDKKIATGQRVKAVISTIVSKFSISWSKKPYQDQSGGCIEYEYVPVCRFEDFIYEWKKRNVRILVHPYSDSLNACYKTANPLIVAYYIGAVPIVGYEEAFKDLGEEQGIYKARADVGSWISFIQELSVEYQWAEMRRRFVKYCESTFLSNTNNNLLEHLINHHKIN